VLQHTRGNKQAAARVLGVDRKTLDRMIKRHRIEVVSDFRLKIADCLTLRSLKDLNEITHRTL